MSTSFHFNLQQMTMCDAPRSGEAGRTEGGAIRNVELEFICMKDSDDLKEIHGPRSCTLLVQILEG